MKATVLPESFLKCMKEEDRKALGKAGVTQAEANMKGTRRIEKELLKHIVNLLRLRGIEPIVSRTDKKTTNNVGLPDILFAVCGNDGYNTRVFACAIEVKLPGEHLREAQITMRRVMTRPPNHWTHRVITSVDEMRMFLEGIGLL